MISSSGGNAGMAVAYAGYKLSMKVVVVVPKTTPASARENIQTYGAEVIVHGSVWDEADKFARKLCDKDPKLRQYCHPFEHEQIWKGHASMVKEIKDNSGTLETQFQAASSSQLGGGLLCGVAEGLHSYGWESVPIVAVETIGAASFNAAKKARKLVRIPGIKSLAKSLACQVSYKTLEWDQKHKIYSLTVSDKKCVRAVESFATDHRMLVEPACAVSLSSIYEDILPSEVLDAKGPVVVIVCGGGIVDLDAIAQWKSMVSTQVDDTMSAYGVPDDSSSHKPGCMELFYTQYVHKLVDVIGYNFPPGPNLVPAYYVINAFKAGTLPFCIFLMNHFNNFLKALI